MSDENYNSTNDPVDSEDLDAVEAEGAVETASASEMEQPTEQEVSESEVLKDQLLRTMADFENYKRRTQKEFTQIIQNANEKLMIEILPVLDDMERALKASKEITSDDPKIQLHVQGLEFIYKKLMKALTDKGLKAMESVGLPLNTDLHDALIQIDAPGKEPNMIVDEHEKGYYLYDKVIRHAKVIVSK
jgi:molecular chaperone GrpE